MPVYCLNEENSCKLTVRLPRGRGDGIEIKKEAEFFFVVVNAQCDEGGVRILQGDNTGGRGVMLRPIRFQCAGVWFSTGLLHINTNK
jgi:hypothetical protein